MCSKLYDIGKDSVGHVVNLTVRAGWTTQPALSLAAGSCQRLRRMAMEKVCALQAKGRDPQEGQGSGTSHGGAMRRQPESV